MPYILVGVTIRKLDTLKISGPVDRVMDFFAIPPYVTMTPPSLQFGNKYWKKYPFDAYVRCSCTKIKWGMEFPTSKLHYIMIHGLVSF